MKAAFHPACSRGLADHGWLYSRHTFSFADYYHPERMGFGLLRVLNDDVVQPGKGFGTHPHANMEIISIPLQGALRHEDSLGSQHVIEAGDVQVMSAGTGVTHSEYNASTEDEVNFLQIWIHPQQRDIQPRYAQRFFDAADREDRFQLLVAPEADSDGLAINQEAWLSLTRISVGNTLEYERRRAGTGVYLFVVDGDVKVAEHRLEPRDGLGLAGSAPIQLNAETPAEVLAIEVPLL
ncbi:MAG: hypothetical protein C0622_04515 [Desulfuromonas sp.]|nr:MAG: hypothetical protein C0622_04515 [Desulfuromonas sp.]